MSGQTKTLSVQHLLMCLTQKQKYKQVSHYVKEVEKQNHNVYSVINRALHAILTTTQYSQLSKLFTLRFFKDLFLTAQFELIDNLDEGIFSQIVKVCQYDKQNKDKSKRGYKYFEQVQKRQSKSTAQMEKASYSFVMFATQIIYVMGEWYKVDQNNQQTDYSMVYENMKKLGIPFPKSIKQLNFFKQADHDTFVKNYNEWLQKLPQVRQEQQEQGHDQVIKKQNSQSQKQKLNSTKNVSQKDARNDENNKKSNSKRKQVLKENDQNQQSRVSSNKKKTLQNDTNEKEIKTKSSGQKNSQESVRIAHLLKKQEIDLKLIAQLQEKLVKRQEQLAYLREDASGKEKSADEQKRHANIEKMQEQKLAHLIKEKAELSSQYLLKIENMKKQHSKEIQRISAKCQQQKSQLADLKRKIQMNQQSKKAKQSQQKQHNGINSTVEEMEKKDKVIKRLQTQKQELLKKINKRQEAQLLQPQNQSSSLQSSHSQDFQKLKKEKQEIEAQMERLGQYYGKEILSLKDEIKNLKTQNEELKQTLETQQKYLKQFESLIKKEKQAKSELAQKLLKSKEQNHNNVDIPSRIKFSDERSIQQGQNVNQQNQFSAKCKPILLKPNKQHRKLVPASRQNSMSDYLSEKPSSYNSRNALSVTLHEGFFADQKVQKRLNSLGKTQQSQSKAAKNRTSQSRLKSKYNRENSLHSQHGKQFNLLSRPSSLKYSQKSLNNTFFNKKSSMYLNKRSPKQIQIQDHSYATTEPPLYDFDHRVQTVLPFIQDYFSMPLHDSFLFRSLCLSHSKRKRTPIFADSHIQIKMNVAKNDQDNLLLGCAMYVLSVTNLSSSESIKVKVISGHDEFRIINSTKNRLVQPNMAAQFEIQTKVKDLNLRYPVFTVLVSSNSDGNNSNCKKISKSSLSRNNNNELKYHVPLPLMLLEFTEFKNSIPQLFMTTDTQNIVKSIRSEVFKLNPKHHSLVRCFQQLDFINNEGTMNSTGSRKGRFHDGCNRVSEWQGTVEHQFIGNIEVVLKMIEMRDQHIILELSFREYDQVSHCFCKAMLQNLLFLLQ